jgi:hypothetical protein
VVRRDSVGHAEALCIEKEKGERRGGEGGANVCPITSHCALSSRISDNHTTTVRSRRSTSNPNKPTSKMRKFTFSNLLPRSGTRPEFLFLLFAIYGLQQGLCTSWLVIGRNYYFKDILHLSSSSAQIMVAITWLPLNIKVKTLHLFSNFALE